MRSGVRRRFAGSADAATGLVGRVTGDSETVVIAVIDFGLLSSEHHARAPRIRDQTLPSWEPAFLQGSSK
jgi:hypothetical protein